MAARMFLWPTSDSTASVVAETMTTRKFTGKFPENTDPKTLRLVCKKCSLGTSSASIELC